MTHGSTAPESYADGAPDRAEPINAPLPSWSLCVATLNRIDILEHSVRLALAQTCPPQEVIIIDASDGWAAHKVRIEALDSWAGTRLVYEHGPIRSITAQRNHALALATSDILFYFDDDTLMHPDCAEKILWVYGTDACAAVASVAASSMDAEPDRIAQTIDTKAKSNATLRERVARILPGRLLQFVYDHILMLGLERRFVPYDSVRYPALAPLDPRLTSAGVFPLRLISGFRVTVRRSVAEKEPFDDTLLAYCPAEDLDATYRYLRHGANVVATRALVYHHETAANRLKRRSVAELSLLNIAYFVRRRARTRITHRVLFYIWAVRILMSCAMRDTVGRRWDYPDTRGSLSAIRKSFAVFRLGPAEIDAAYKTIQRGILATATPVTKAGS